MNQRLPDLVLSVDESLLVVNKPAGLPSLPDGYHPDLPHLKSILEPQFGPLWIVHRLDKDTSGIMLLARTPTAHRNLNTQFEHRQVSKKYHALVGGQPHWQAITVNLPLRSNAGSRHRTVVDHQDGKPALTELKLLEIFPGCSLVAAFPKTGRTHQIRAHLAALGYPIIGDNLYSTRTSQAGGLSPAGKQIAVLPGGPFLDRLALHALSITVSHPDTGQPITYTAPYSADFSELLERLRGQRT